MRSERYLKISKFEKEIEIIEKIDWSQYGRLICVDMSASLDLVAQTGVILDVYETRIQDMWHAQNVQKQFDNIKNISPYSLFRPLSQELNYNGGICWLEASQEKNLLTILRLAQVVHGDIYCVGANDQGIKGLQNKLKKNGFDAEVEVVARGARILKMSSENLKRQTLRSLDLKSVKAQIGQVQLEWLSGPGIFSQDKLDVGTEQLLQTLPSLKGLRVLDLGCGSGVIAQFAMQSQAQKVVAVDADYWSFELTQKSFQKEQNEQVEVLWGFMADSCDEKYFDMIITNPPFHVGKRELQDLGDDWLKSCKRVLKTEGQIYLVANQFIPYHDFAQKNEFKAEIIVKKNGFIVWKML